MRKKVFGFLLVVATGNAAAQMAKVDGKVKLKELEVPNSPAFIIADITPSLIQTPTTPKQFVLGAAQSFQQSGDGFPKNYSLEFAPYWWLKPTNRNVYSLVGLERGPDGNIGKENPFSGLKFTSFSMAFLSKDAIPDSITAAQKLFSFGVRTTLFKIHLKTYAEDLKTKIKAWHSAAQTELSTFQEAIARAEPLKKAELLKQAANYRPSTTQAILEEINNVLLQKPILSWDVAAAHVAYGVGDTLWRKGRSGIWSNISSNLPLGFGDPQKTNKEYINLNFSIRLLSDNFYQNSKGAIASSHLTDVGGKIAFETHAFSIGYEYFKRHGKGISDDDKRSVGVINYKLSDNLFINGAFGKNFNVPDKLIALLGIKWGIGSETISLPQ